jgi:hypothetical protein
MRLWWLSILVVMGAVLVLASFLIVWRETQRENERLRARRSGDTRRDRDPTMPSR